MFTSKKYLFPFERYTESKNKKIPKDVGINKPEYEIQTVNCRCNSG